jgi:hypothetical protein
VGQIGWERRGNQEEGWWNYWALHKSLHLVASSLFRVRLLCYTGAGSREKKTYNSGFQRRKKHHEKETAQDRH